MPTKPLPPALPQFALFDSQDASGAPGRSGAWLLTRPREAVSCTDPSAWEACLQRLEDATRGGAWVALAASYELGYAIEPRLRPLLPPGHGALVTGWVFEHGEWLDEAACEAWLASQAGDDPGGTSRMQPALREADYLQQVARIRHYIAAGDCYQVNLTFPLDGEAFGNPARLYQALRAAQPAPATATAIVIAMIACTGSESGKPAVAAETRCPSTATSAASGRVNAKAARKAGAASRATLPVGLGILMSAPTTQSAIRMPTRAIFFAGLGWVVIGSPLG